MTRIDSTLEGSRQAYMLGSEDSDSAFLFRMVSDDPVRWERVRGSDRVDISSGNEKFATLTHVDVMSILGVDRVPLVFTEHQLRELDVALMVRKELFENPNFSTREKAGVLRSVRRSMGRGRPDGGGAPLDKLGHNQIIQNAEQAVKDILDAFGNRPLVLQRPTGTVFHRAREAFENGDVLLPLADETHIVSDVERTGLRGGLAGDHHIFLVEHNWAGAFADAGDLDGEERHLPYPLVAFEFQVNSRRIIVNIAQRIDGQVDEMPELASIVVIQTKFGWMLPMVYEFAPGGFEIPSRIVRRLDIADTTFIRVITPLMALIHSQIRAILIMLSAKVAETPVVRIPHKLNEARKKKGKKPMFDYHVVSLSKRTRYEALPTGPYHEPAHRKRLHWRRGHYRHYQNHKVWIARQLVGNPDLGFIDKHYRL